jgi:hypothetical protein
MSIIPMKIKLRRGLAADWTTKNPVLEDGEPGFELDTFTYKIGDGVHAWNDLPYYVENQDTALVFVWDGVTYQPEEHFSSPSRQKWFTGPVDPITVGAVLAEFDQWIDTS